MAGLVVVVAAGCGTDDADPAPTVATERSSESPDSEGTPTEASLPPGTPPCVSVWKEDATLPRGYDGCSDETGQYVVSDPLACSSGQKIIRFDDHYYAVPGGTIHAADASLDKDSEYRAAALRCRA